MTIEDIREYKKNAVEILRKHDQYATAKAVEEAFMSLACLGQYMWERDVAISQLEELGLSLGANTEEIQKAVNIYKKIPEVIEELEGLKMSMDGQIFYNQASKLIYEERMESTNETVDEAINIVRQLLGN